MEPNNELEADVGGRPAHDSEGSQPESSGSPDPSQGCGDQVASSGRESTGVSDDADSQEREAPIVKLGPEHEPRVDAQDLVPWFSTHQDAPLLEGAHARSKRGFDPLAIAAGIAALGLIGIGCLAAYDHVRQSAMFAVKAQESENLAANVDMLKGRLDALEASRGHDDAADLHKLLGEIKAGAAATQAFGASFAQLSARVDKLGERIDHDSAAHFADIAARIDKLEKKAASQVVAANAPVAPAKPTLSPASAGPNVSNDITGSIDKPKPLLRGFTLDDIRDGMAMIDGRQGPISVAPGDVIPGAGRVIKFERRGRDWVVVTTVGIIAADPEIVLKSSGALEVSPGPCEPGRRVRRRSIS